MVLEPGYDHAVRRRGAISCVLASAAASCALVVSGADAQSPPPLQVPQLGQFRSVLAQGEGESTSAGDLTAFEANGTVPQSFTDQQPLYVGIMPHAATLTPADLDVYYKDTDFGSMPGGVGPVTIPRAGVEIFRDKRFQMAHVYGANRYDVMFGAGYAQAQERLFLMDVLRHLAKGTLAQLLGPSGVSSDAGQLTNQDFSDQEMDAQFAALPRRFGAAGARAQSDLNAFIDGINARINEVNQNPSELPAEYPALGVKPQPWTVSDSAAEAIFLVTQFTVSNGGEEINATLEEAFQRRFGKHWFAPYHDLREANDPEAFTVVHTPFYSDNPGKVLPGRNLVPDFGSIRPRNPVVSGPTPTLPSEPGIPTLPQASGNRAAAYPAPAWVKSIGNLRSVMPHVESNAVLVSPKMSSDGRPLAAMGPQVGYYSPQIFTEYELHGGGINSEGVTFPGAAPWPLIGHGIDFAWTGTSANGDNEDTFVERLCNADGSRASDASTHYLYRGRCIPFVSRDVSITTPYSPTNPTVLPQKITYRTLRSVHGPVFAYATVRGRPVALTVAKAVDFHELDAAIPFMELSENDAHNVKSFIKIMGRFPGSENWFYVDNRGWGYIQSGRYQRHARHSNVDLPFNGDGRGDWVDFNPSNYTFAAIPASHRPTATSRNDRFIVSWNNKEAPGWRKGPTEWSDGPVHHAMILQEHLLAQARAHHGKVNLTELTRAVNLAATTDLRGEDVYPWMRRVIGRARGRDGQLLAILDSWHRSGSHRLATNGNYYDHSAAVALFDAWWTRFVTAEFEPALGTSLFDLVERDVLNLGGVDEGFGWDWSSQVQKDLRNVLGRRERGRYSHVYCGGYVAEPLSRRALARSRRRCRQVLLRTLSSAAAAIAAHYHSQNPATWLVPATCPQTNPPSCDQEVPTTAGAIDTPPFPWQNRGTFHQVDEIYGRR